MFVYCLQNKNSDFCAPLTSFDWNEVDPNLLGTSSIDTTCTIWGLEVSLYFKDSICCLVLYYFRFVQVSSRTLKNTITECMSQYMKYKGVKYLDNWNSKFQAFITMHVWNYNRWHINALVKLFDTRRSVRLWDGLLYTIPLFLQSDFRMNICKNWHNFAYNKTTKCSMNGDIYEIIHFPWQTGQRLGRVNLVNGHVKTQLIAHDKEVYDIAFSRAGGKSIVCKQRKYVRWITNSAYLSPPITGNVFVLEG